MTLVHILYQVLALCFGMTICSTEKIFIELRDGSSNNEGTLFVKRGSDWGLVCDDGWSLINADVVCRQLGFPGRKDATLRNKFRTRFTSEDRIFLDDVRCHGYEENIGNCIHREWFQSNCNTGEAAGVVCATTESELSIVNFVEPPRSAQRAFRQRFGRYRQFRESFGYRPRYRERFTPRPLGSRHVEPVYAPDVPPRPPRIERTTQTTTTTTTTAKPTTTTTTKPTTTPEPPRYNQQRDQGKEITEEEDNQINHLLQELEQDTLNEGFQKADIVKVTLEGGRHKKEGYVKVTLSDGRSGVICAENWDISEAKVVCSQASNGMLAQRATTSDFFNGKNEEKLFYEVSCDGHERSFSDCMVKYTDNHGVRCPRRSSVAGVICTNVLPDLLPNITTLMESARLEDRTLGHLSCAMEEDCVSSSAYELKEKYSQRWNSIYRRLLRFSSWVYNNGTADFLPSQSRSTWEWHSCHMHYHSMAEFSHYDILDAQGNRVAEGHKASFCLEDVKCDEGVSKKYQCSNFGNQGIRVGCADIYKWDIDCQWIDISDLRPGAYVFKLNVNPEQAVPELNFDNNAALCELKYTGDKAIISNCVLARG